MPSTQPSIVNISETARKEIARLLEKEERQDLGLRLSVSGGGCSGFTYKIEFDLQADADHISEFPDGIRVFIDPQSITHLKGVTVDYQDGLSGRGFVFNNPNASSTCGCGESFCA